MEDFVPFRQFILSTLAAKPDIKIVGEVSNGFAAVNKSLELQPDLILLDIGLPGLDGINAVRQIRNLAPDSKIIFLTQESSADIVQEALSLGARGYVLKIKAASELLRALEAVLLGKTFVSSTLLEKTFVSSTMGRFGFHVGYRALSNIVRELFGKK